MLTWGTLRIRVTWGDPSLCLQSRDLQGGTVSSPTAAGALDGRVSLSCSSQEATRRWQELAHLSLGTCLGQELEGSVKPSAMLPSDWESHSERELPSEGTPILGLVSIEVYIFR